MEKKDNFRHLPQSCRSGRRRHWRGNRVGEAIIEAFAGQQAKIVVLDIQDVAAENLIRRLVSSGYPAPTYHQCDLTDTEALQQTIGWLIPSTGMPVYVTAKAAIVGLTRTLAHELGADNIRVNCILPGAILTQRQKQLWFTPAYEAEILSSQAIKRMILPEEVARLVLFLAADDSEAITNKSYVIDGGWI